MKFDKWFLDLVGFLGKWFSQLMILMVIVLAYGIALTLLVALVWAFKQLIFLSM